MKIFISIALLFISLFGFSQSPTRGALVTIDTSNFSNAAGFTKPTIKMLAVNKLDNSVVFWDLYSWNTVAGGGSVINIYNTDGTISGNRAIDGNQKDVLWYNNHQIEIGAYGTNSLLNIAQNDGSGPGGATTNIVLNDSIIFDASIGKYYIRQLPSSSNPTDSMVVINSDGKVGQRVLPTSGTYTPTLTNTTNIAASTAYVTSYMRVGNVVTVGFKVDIDATLAANTATLLGFSLPIGSNFTAEEDAGGTAASDAIASLVVRIKADATNDRVSLVFKSLSLTNDSFNGSFTYIIK